MVACWTGGPCGDTQGKAAIIGYLAEVRAIAIGWGWGKAALLLAVIVADNNFPPIEKTHTQVALEQLTEWIYSRSLS